MPGIWTVVRPSRVDRPQVIAGARSNAQQHSPDGATAASYHSTFETPRAATGLEFLYVNDSDNPITVRASVEPGGQIIGRPRIYFNGGVDVTIGPRGHVWSDPVHLPVYDTLVAVNTFVSGSSGWQLTHTPARSGEATNVGSGNQADLTATGSFPASDTTLHYAPTAIRAMTNGVPVVSVASIGDSIQAGSVDTAGAGFVLRAFNAAPFQDGRPTASVVTVALGGEGAADLPRQDGLRWAAIAACTHAVEGYGVNDMNEDIGGVSVATFLPRVAEIWRHAQLEGVRVIRRTLTPYDQATATTKQRIRDANAYFRAGAPLDPSSLLPVPIGTGGALLIGAPGHPVVGLWEAADAIETGRDTGTNQPGLTADGIHPNAAGHAAIAAACPLSAFGLS